MDEVSSVTSTVEPTQPSTSPAASSSGVASICTQRIASSFIRRIRKVTLISDFAAAAVVHVWRNSGMSGSWTSHARASPGPELGSPVICVSFGLT